jgi:NAD+ kinase
VSGSAFTIGLVVHPTNPVHESVESILEFTRQRGYRVVASHADATRLGTGVEAVSPEEFVDLADVALSLGGDGTMLGAMRLLVGRPTPVLGVNHGNLGFLVEIQPAGLRPALDRIANGEYALEPHTCLRFDPGDGTEYFAFNDVVVTTDRLLTPIVVDIGVGQSGRLGYYRCDAVIASTPTGSTAYNYASGGPIISPSIPCLALTPVAPMSGISRTIIVGDDVVALDIPDDSPPARYAVDGMLSEPVQPGARLTLRLCPEPVNVMRLDLRSHALRASVKLSLLDLPLRPEQLADLFPPHLREQAERLRSQQPPPTP